MTVLSHKISNSQTEDVIEFADSWRTGTEQCQDDVTIPDFCLDDESYDAALDVCYILINEDGKFCFLGLDVNQHDSFNRQGFTNPMFKHI